MASVASSHVSSTSASGDGGISGVRALIATAAALIAAVCLIGSWPLAALPAVIAAAIAWCIWLEGHPVR